MLNISAAKSDMRASDLHGLVISHVHLCPVQTHVWCGTPSYETPATLHLSALGEQMRCHEGLPVLQATWTSCENSLRSRWRVEIKNEIGVEMLRDPKRLRSQLGALYQGLSFVPGTFRSWPGSGNQFGQSFPWASVLESRHPARTFCSQCTDQTTGD